MITDEDLMLALDRIARTPDGELFYRYLQKVAIGIVADNASDGTLRENHGRRSFAHQLMGQMAKGIDESGGRADDTGSGGGVRTSERPVVFAVRQPANVSRRESFREHAIRTDPELGGKPGGGES